MNDYLWWGGFLDMPTIQPNWRSVQWPKGSGKGRKTTGKNAKRKALRRKRR